MKRKLIFFLFAAFLLTPWPVAYAHDNAMAGQYDMHVEVAQEDRMPEMNSYGNAIGGVTPGDLFYIDTSNSTADIPLPVHFFLHFILLPRIRYGTLILALSH